MAQRGRMTPRTSGHTHPSNHLLKGHVACLQTHENGDTPKLVLGVPESNHPSLPEAKR